MAVLVAGGTGALGGAVLRELAESGYDVTATWLVEREAERIEAELGDAVRLLQADLLDPAGAAGAVEAVEDLEAVVNLVGGFSDGPKVHETDPDDFRKMIRLNVEPAFLLARAAMPVLSERGGGAFVAVSARAGAAAVPRRGRLHHRQGRGALAFVKALDAEYKAPTACAATRSCRA